MIYWIIFIAIYVIGFVITWFKVKKYFTNNTWYEKAVACILWPVILILYLIHYFHNK